MEPTDAQLIEKRLNIRAYLEKEQEEFDKRMKPYNDAATAIEGLITQRMIDQGIESLRTEKGTAYRERTMQAKVVNRDVFMNFVVNNGEFGFITNHITKEAVKEYVDKNNTAPPGVDVSYFTKTKFRVPS